MAVITAAAPACQPVRSCDHQEHNNDVEPIKVMVIFMHINVLLSIHFIGLVRKDDGFTSAPMGSSGPSGGHHSSNASTA